MASQLKNLSHYTSDNIPSGKDMVFGIVVSDWNEHITHRLYDGCVETLAKHGVQTQNIHMVQVAGAFELPVAARLLAAKYPAIQAVICLGCVIKGETNHDEYINMSVANALQNMAIASGKAFIFGLLTTNNEVQAVERAGGKLGNKGIEAAITALRMAELKEVLDGKKKGVIGF